MKQEMNIEASISIDTGRELDDDDVCRAVAECLDTAVKGLGDETAAIRLSVWSGDTGNLQKLNDEEINAMLDRIGELEKALKPFADYSRSFDPDPLTISDWKRAEEAMPSREGLNLDDILAKL